MRLTRVRRPRKWLNDGMLMMMMMMMMLMTAFTSGFSPLSSRLTALACDST